MSVSGQQQQQQQQQQQAASTSFSLGAAVHTHGGSHGALVPGMQSLQLQQRPAGGTRISSCAEAVGMRVGERLAERYSRDRPRMGDTLEIIKFVCKDFWLAVFRKQVDNLRTNHRGVFVLSDSNFRWLSRLPPAPPVGSDPPTPEAAAQRAAAAAVASNQLHLACGVLAGALSQLGVACVVEADAHACPAAAFTVRITMMA
ncbi:hypothetical protein FOA52_008072 [Chlamydomonas sp. UWO 241]|nr:hypothetical protein FOA52_008072 [Chlamydomonas sp. UWO 241]